MKRSWLVSAGAIACSVLSASAGASPPVAADPTPHSPPVHAHAAPASSYRPRLSHPPANLPKLGDWNRGLQGPDRDQAGTQWRQLHHGWDNDAPWRRDPDWWRHHWAFRWFYGPRIGFFFIPEVGYVAIPPDIQMRYWVVGNYLPSWFWGHVVRDYWNFGLPQPPDGCVWVWVDNDVALIDPTDGYIIDIVHNVW